MKKIISMALVALMALTISFNAMAVEFVPSVSNKGAPDIVTTPDENGDMIGQITDGDGNLISKEYTDCIIITPVKDADSSTEISDEARENLKEAFDKLNEPGANLSDLCPELKDIIKDALGNNASVDDLVIMDVFDISSNCENIDKYLNGGDNSMKVTFRLPLEGNQFVTAMVYVDGKWQTVPSVVNNGDGTVTVELNQLGAIAFLTYDGEAGGNGATGDGSTSPATGDTDFNQIILWGSVMGVSVIAIIGVLVVFTRRKKSSK